MFTYRNSCIKVCNKFSNRRALYKIAESVVEINTVYTSCQLSDPPCTFQVVILVSLCCFYYQYG